MGSGLAKNANADDERGFEIINAEQARATHMITRSSTSRRPYPSPIKVGLHVLDIRNMRNAADVPSVAFIVLALGCRLHALHAVLGTVRRSSNPTNSM